MPQKIWDNYGEAKQRKPLYIGKLEQGTRFREDFPNIVRHRYLDSRTKMLDLGCGTADDLLKYSFGAKEVYGIDTNKRLLEQARKNAENRPEIRILRMSAECLDFPDAEFDLITNVFTPQNEKSCKESFRVLKNGGHYIRTAPGEGFVELCNGWMTRPQDVVGRGAYFRYKPGQKIQEDKEELQSAGFIFPEFGIREFKAARYYRRMQDITDSIKDSPTFTAHPPFEPLSDTEIAKLLKKRKKFEYEVPFHGGMMGYALPEHNLLMIAYKP